MRRIAGHTIPFLALCAGCGAGPGGNSGFGTTPGTSGAPGSSSNAGSSSTGPGEGSTTSSTSSSSADASTHGEPLRDVGADRDLGSPQPAGCQGKIDFLFVVSRQGFMADIQKQVIEAVPKFIDTIETKFVDFDYHIMVIDGEPDWGLSYCTEECPNIGPPPCGVLDYPCDLLDQVTTCDETIGAGVVFNAGSLAYNKPCNLPGGRRYIAKGDPNMVETFTCMAQGGESGGDWLGESLTAAMSPQLREGCNLGFLRDDALLVITIVTKTPDDDSDGTPEEWYQAVVDAKHGDPNAIVAFGIVNEFSPEWCDTYAPKYWPHRMCELLRRFPYHTSIDCDVPDYGPAFDAATDLVGEACDAFIPG